MKNKTVKALAGFLALLMLAGSLSACSGESFGSRLKNLFNPGGTHDGVTTVRPPRTTAPETTTQLSEMDEKMQLAPVLEGAKKVIKEINGYKRVTYVAEAGNPYGAEAGTYLGEFKKEVTLEGKEVGGVALIPSVVEKLLEDALDKIPEGEDKWMVFVPADISELKNKDSKIEMEILDSSLGFKDSVFKVNFNGENVSISNLVYDPTGEAGFTNQIVAPSLPDTPVAFGCYILPDSEYKQIYLSVYGKFEFPERIDSPSSLPFGKKVTETNSSIIVAMVSDKSVAPITDNRILEVYESPVFMIDK